MANYLVKVSYNGSYFYGWQAQPRFHNTVEESITKLLSKLLDEKVVIFGAGRTDKGVHAYNQCFNFKSNKVKDINRLKYAFNRLIGPYIKMNSIEEVSEDFHARFSAISKTYLYKINTNEKDVFNEKTIYQLNRKLDIEKMKEYSSLFIGEHCFYNFTTKEIDDKEYVRTIYDIQINENNGVLDVILIGNGFMRYMVRMIVGTLIKAGLKKITKEKIIELLNTKESMSGTFKAPAEGLYLVDVDYGRNK